MKHTLNKQSRILLITALVLILSFLPSCVAKRSLNNFLSSSKDKPQISSEGRQLKAKTKAKDQSKPQEQDKSPDKGQEPTAEKREGQLETEAETQAPKTKREAEALAVAKRYLTLMKGQFSQESLLRQLAFEGFSPEEAQYAVDNCGEDWFAAAKNRGQYYLELGGFSCQSLIEMLTEQEGFTLEEATYAADSFEVDWMEQAAMRAEFWVTCILLRSP